jgi:hypothetical protein
MLSDLKLHFQNEEALGSKKVEALGFIVQNAARVPIKV